MRKLTKYVSMEERKKDSVHCMHVQFLLKSCLKGKKEKSCVTHSLQNTFPPYENISTNFPTHRFIVFLPVLSNSFVRLYIRTLHFTHNIELSGLVGRPNKWLKLAKPDLNIQYIKTYVSRNV